MDQLDRDAGDRVREAIEAAGMSLNQAAANSGIPRVTLLRRLGRGGDFTLREIDALGRALDIPPHTLYPNSVHA